MLEVSLLLAVGTVLRLERDAWSMVKRLRQAKNEYAPIPSPRTDFSSSISPQQQGCQRRKGRLWTAPAEGCPKKTHGIGTFFVTGLFTSKVVPVGGGGFDRILTAFT